jgi:hypothetical protein
MNKVLGFSLEEIQRGANQQGGFDRISSIGMIF